MDHHLLKPRGGAAGREAPTAAAGPDHHHHDSSRSSRGGGGGGGGPARWLAAAGDLLDGSGGGGGGGKGGGRWLRRMLALVIVLHVLLIAAVLYASPFDGHHGNHAHQNLPLAPEDAAADAAAALAASAGVNRGSRGVAPRALVREEEEEEEEEEEGEGEDLDVEGYEEEEEEEAAAVEDAGEAAAAAGKRPEAFEECGFWQEGYMDLHRRILAGEAPQRYLVSVAYKGGLADQLVGIVTTFYWALLTDRAFQLTVGYQRLPKFEAAFDAPFVNWTRPQDPKELTEHLYAAHRGPRHFPEGVDTEQYGSRYLVNNNKQSEFLLHENLWEANEQPTLFVASNRGRSFRLFDNPHHRQQLHAMGLRPETAFGCAFRFLFAPNAATLKTHEEEFKRLMPEGGTQPWPKTRPAMTPAGVGAARRLEAEDKGGDAEDLELQALPPLKIGIQIRVGDFIFQSKAREQSLKLEDYMSYFDCATQIENHQRGHPDRKILWYLISDSARLRQLALERFGAEKLITQTAAAHHIVCGKTDKCKDTDEEQQNAALTAAAGDMLSLSMTDFQVLTDRSGFGKVASAIGMGWHTVWFGGGYPVHRKGQADNKRAEKAKQATAHCGPKRFVSYEKLADKWSGI